MTIRRLLIRAALAVFISLNTGGGFFTPPPAAAFSSFGTDGNSDEGGNPAVRDFLKSHGMTLIVCLGVGMGLLFVLLIGPADVLDAARRQQGMGGFGWGRCNHGLFGSSTDSTPGFGSGGFGSSFKI